MDMDMGTMDMPATATTGSAAAATSTGMGDMGHEMGGCKISMLWNWNTVDSCFISSSWQVTSPGMFAGSCIGVILLVMSLELLRRAVKEYDAHLVRKHAASTTTEVVSAAASAREGYDSKSHDTNHANVIAQGDGGFRPNIFEQAVRALLHTVQFAVAYFVMLLAMYYNGYIIICILIGAFMGAFVFQWEKLGRYAKTSASKEATVCCG